MDLDPAIYAPAPGILKAAPGIPDRPVERSNVACDIDQFLLRQRRPGQQFKLFHLALMRVFIRLIG
ncbi:hypothetical protein WT10_10270 [Burkholderia stagnalis]|nr:hypothetical protein WS59_20420 [Burkholderia stagnalis]KVN21740.1 hypothetical protein WT10_10270 [Burkholderia stagnalis]KVN58961.1 hypothetical protein WT14_21460 [Burkholderia stagnalis]KWI65261.1 hypothetical protein WT75_27815 [Burkholderia stagnalis]KWK62956.1 hypothetical protein WT82_01910 [Burkholderia stagnalis]